MKAFDNSEFEKYKAEAHNRWGDTDAYKEHTEKTKSYSSDKWQSVTDGLNGVLSKFSICMKNGEKPESSVSQNLVKELQSYITDNYYTCTTDVLAGLSQMYVADERFKKNIDKHAQGTAQFLSKAIDFYCKKS